MRQREKKHRKRLPGGIICISTLLLLFAGAEPAYAENSAAVQGSYAGQYQNVYTTVLQGTEKRISLPGGESLTALEMDTSDRGTRLLVTPVGKTETEAYKWVSGQTGAKGKEPYAYYVAFYGESSPKTLSGEIWMSLSVPNGYEAEAFWFLTPDGELSRVNAQAAGGTVAFAADSEGYYLFLKPLSESGNSGNNTSGGTTGGNSGNSSSGGTTGGNSGNSGSGGTTGGNSGNSSSGGTTGGNTGNNGSGGTTGTSSSTGSSSGGRDSGGRSNSSANGTSERPIRDHQKGYMTPSLGILTGQTGSSARDGYSHWMLDERGWRLLYADGTWAKGSEGDAAADGNAASAGSSKEICHWEKINGKDFVFGADSYARLGWFYEESGNAGYWYYIDENEGRKTGWHMDNGDGYQYYLDGMGQMVTDWQKIDGKWYYFNPDSPARTWEYDSDRHTWNYLPGAGRPFGSMYRNEETPDGHFVGADGAWNGR